MLDAAPPVSLGRYALLRRLAVGGMGEIFLARERGEAGFERLVVVKRLLRDGADDAEPLTLFLDEARIAAHLAHPNIVQVHELGQDHGEYFIAMELVPGQHLGRVLARLSRDDRRLPIPVAGYIVVEAARGLAYAHQARDPDGHPLQIVHRDVSPSNLLIGYRGDVKVADFGIAKATNRQAHTRTGLVRGKLSYMAPEQLRSQPVDARCDVWALGVVLWEATVGRRLFPRDGDLDTVRTILEEPIPRPSAVIRDYPPELEEIVMRALDRDLDRRTPSAEALGHDLRAVLRAGPGIADATELAALMRDLFPRELAELAGIAAPPAEAPAAPPPAAPPAVTASTVQLASSPPPPDPVPRAHDAPGDARTTPARGRGARRAIVAGAAAAAAVAAIGVGVRAWRATSPQREASAATAAAAPDAAAAAAPRDATPSPTLVATGSPAAAHDPDGAVPAAAVDAGASTAPPETRPDAGRPRRWAPRGSPGAPEPPTAGEPPDAGVPVTAAAPDASVPPPAVARPAEIRIKIDGAEIRVDGGRRHPSPLTLRQVEPGPHTIEVVLEDGRAISATIDVRPGELLKCRVARGALRCDPS